MSKPETRSTTGATDGADNCTHGRGQYQCLWALKSRENTSPSFSLSGATFNTGWSWEESGVVVAAADAAAVVRASILPALLKVSVGCRSVTRKQAAISRPPKLKQ